MGGRRLPGITKSESRLKAETFRSGVAQGLPRKSAGKPEPGIRASSYGQRIVLFGARGGLSSPESP